MDRGCDKIMMITMERGSGKVSRMIKMERGCDKVGRMVKMGSGCDSGISETLKKVSVSTTFAQSRLVSVSTTPKLLSLEESQYRQLKIF